MLVCVVGLVGCTRRVGTETEVGRRRRWEWVGEVYAGKQDRGDARGRVGWARRMGDGQGGGIIDLAGDE
jgi:hypothetical protein